MADEIEINLSWTIAKNGRSRTLTASSTQWDMAGNVWIDNCASIGFAAHEALALGDVTTPTFGYFKNLNATNFVQIGYDATGAFKPFLKLLAGQECAVWLDASMAVPYAKADTGAVLLDYVLAQA